MSPTEIDDFYMLASSLDPLHVSEYLDAQGWELLERHEDFLEYWLEPSVREGLERETSPYLLPLDNSMRNFQRRFVEFLTELAGYYECSADQLGGRLKERAWDAFLIHLAEGGSRYDSVDLALAGRVIQAGFNLVRISALHTANPWRSLTGGGARGSTVNQYLSENVRLGHTEHGSFVFPILSLAKGDSRGGSLFGRRVFENLAKGLHRISELPTMSGGVREGLASAGHFEVALVHALQTLGGLSDVTSFDISFRWASRGELPQDVPRQRISLNPELIRTLGELVNSPESIDRGEAPSAAGLTSYRKRLEISSAEVTEFTGKVVAFGMDDRQVQSSGGSPYFIVIRPDTPSEVADTRIFVSERQYSLAIRSREQGEPLTAIGYFSYRREGWHLEGELRFSPRVVAE